VRVSGAKADRLAGPRNISASPANMVCATFANRWDARSWGKVNRESEDPPRPRQHRPGGTVPSECGARSSPRGVCLLAHETKRASDQFERPESEEKHRSFASLPADAGMRTAASSGAIEMVSSLMRSVFRRCVHSAPVRRAEGSSPRAVEHSADRTRKMTLEVLTEGPARGCPAGAGFRLCIWYRAPPDPRGARERSHRAQFVRAAPSSSALRRWSCARGSVARRLRRGPLDAAPSRKARAERQRPGT